FVAADAQFGRRDSLLPALAALRTAIRRPDQEYFEFLARTNVEWIGISIALHYDSFSNPVVNAENCTSGGMKDTGGNYTSCAFYDQDLESFIARARQRGFKIYLTLAFETSVDIDSAS